MIKFITKKGDIPAYVLLYKYKSRGCDLYLTEKLKIMREGPELPLKKISKSQFYFREQVYNKFRWQTHFSEH